MPNFQQISRAMFRRPNIKGNNTQWKRPFHVSSYQNFHEKYTPSPATSKFHNLIAPQASRRDELKENIREFLKLDPTINSLPASNTLEALEELEELPLYSKVTSTEVLKAYLCLSLVSNPVIVEVGNKILASKLMELKLISRPILSLLKKTIYSHFCAGENVSEASHKLKRIRELGLKGILDYSVEDALDEGTCEENLQGFLNTIKISSKQPPGSVSFACVKITALCPIQTLEHASQLLRWKQGKPGIVLPWTLSSLPALSENSVNMLPKRSPDRLSVEEEKQIQRAFERLSIICDLCTHHGLPLLIDAEYQSVQPMIDHLAYAAAIVYNKQDLPLVYSTVQCYLKDAKSRLELSLKAAQDRKVAFGVKLVRGAYLNREVQLAKEHGTQSPVHDSIASTHSCYDDCASIVMAAAVKKSTPASLVLATHNYNSGRSAVLRASELGLSVSSPLLQFAQLQGMADDLSLGLAMAGCNVSKYLPYGPVADVLPYLVRRAEENKGMLGNSGIERKKLRQELYRRMLATVNVHSR